MASLLNLNLQSPLQAQANTLHEEVDHRTQLVASLETARSRLSSLHNEIIKGSQESAELLKQFEQSNAAQNQQNSEDRTDENSIEALSKLAHFLMDLKKTESLEKLYPKISNLKSEARSVEADVVKLDTEVKCLKEITSQMRLLLAKKRETTKRIQESKSNIADLASKV
jgi:chromosome segregation ATPase